MITPSYGLTATERVLPAMMLDFLSGVLDSRITFVRASTATFTGSNGLLQTAAIDAPRFDYDPVTLAPKGLLIEETRTNLLLNSDIAGTDLATQSATVAAQSYVLTFYGTGTVTLSGAHFAVIVGDGAYPARKTYVFTPSAGALLVTVVGTVQYAQIEAGAFATSFIPTAGAPVARSPDQTTITSTNFSSWYNQTQGAFVTSSDCPANGIRAEMSVDDGTVNNMFRMRSQNTDPFFVARVGGANVVILDGGTITANAPYTQANAYAANNYGVSVNGGAAVTSASGAVPTVNRMTIGWEIAGFYINGHIRKIWYYKIRPTDQQLQAFSLAS